MNLRSGTSILLMVLLAASLACSGDDTLPPNALILGDPTSVDFFQAFDPPRQVSFRNEQRLQGYNRKNYHDSLFLDQDGTVDMILYYHIVRMINGDSVMVTNLTRENDNTFFLGDSVEWNGIFWDRALFNQGEVVSPDYGYWQTTEDNYYTFNYYTFDVYQYSADTREVYQRTAFQDSRTGYVVFQYDRGEDILFGWLQLTITGTLRIPQTDNYGYKVIPKTN